MKRTTTIVLFASIFAVTVGTLGLSGSSATSLMIAPQTQQVGMLGHVEYMVQDASGNTVQYMQGDNVVVNDGEDCAADAIFGSGTCITGDFNWIGIGNGSSSTTDPTNSTLADATDDTTATCASFGVGGEMARRQVTAQHTAASGSTGAIVVLDTSSVPFTFTASNDTAVIDSGVFNGNFATPGSDHTCGTGGTAGTNWEMFSRQLLNSATGITVNAGDSLSVKWTITVG